MPRLQRTLGPFHRSSRINVGVREMTCTILFVIRCDATWLDESLIHRCKNEMLGMDRERVAVLQSRARAAGWLIEEERHLCPKHAS